MSNARSPFIRIPRQLIQAPPNKALYLSPYIFISLTRTYSCISQFHIKQFADFVGRKRQSDLALHLQESLQQMEASKYIARDSVKPYGKSWFAFKINHNFFIEQKSFALMFVDDIWAICNTSQTDSSKLLYLLAYLKLKMSTDGVLYKTFRKLSDEIGINEKTVSKLAKILCNLGIIASEVIRIPYRQKNGSIGWRNITIFADKHNDHWVDNLANLKASLKSHESTLPKDDSW